MNHLAAQASGPATTAIVRKKVIEAFGRHGVKLTKIDATTLKTDDGHHVTLENLTARCVGAPRRYWDEIVEIHVATMLESQRLSDPQYLLNMPDDEFYMRLRERVTAPSALPGRGDFRYSSPLVDAPNSPRRVLNLTFPDLALTLEGRYLENRDLEAAWAFGRDNTAAMTFDDRETLTKDDVTIDVCKGDSIYLASKVANMPTLIADHLGDSPFGVLFVVPNAYEIDYYKPFEFDATVRASTLLVQLARIFSRDTPNPLSQDLYFWRDGQYCQVNGSSSADLFERTLAEL
ncbi:hypothetical protein CH293_04690 [Rhodococcus sp. 14-2470-1b]|uniref:hypothetical protein n=1 Tax=Rhodococcus sp. 14-2470-1b TaxID=2023149 RepID=UPI000B9C6651|nr:hypothetical protein [Rhodococcus sp. 14-2470-1b]OZF56480.1 hypothetical protein CH293_04690 [Rhodococcus sp. 14-2470-1b]